MKYIQVVVELLLCCCLYACSPCPESVQPADRLLELYPEYQDVTIPCNVAPLNFLVRNEGLIYYDNGDLKSIDDLFEEKGGNRYKIHNYEEYT